tara:strand:+ start:2655 stop:3134 length:480 start_codon:yes stop_codon:yes gene_type:complete
MGSARLAYVQKQIRVYRVAFSDLSVGGAGVGVELAGAANKLITLRHLQMSKPSGAVSPIQLEKLSAACTGGTSTTPTPVPNRTSHAAANGVVKLYTAAPTKGALIDQIQEIDLATTDVVNEAFDPNNGAYALEAAAERLVLTFPGAVTFNGYIEWQEEP